MPVLTLVTCCIRKFTLSTQVHERHRHRYEVNPDVVRELESAGMHLVGRNTDGTGERMEVLELSETDHPYFMGAQVSSFVFVPSYTWVAARQCLCFIVRTASIFT